MIKGCKPTELASDWFETFNSAVKHKVWLESDSMLDADTLRRKRKKAGSRSSDDTVMKCRFANALYDVEKSGIIKCHTAGADKSTITIERKIYTWV